MDRLRGRSDRQTFNDGGLGLGSTFICAVVAVTYYFERYRGVASCIASAGTGVGYIVVPLALNSLITCFDKPIGWRHSVLVYSFILTATTFVNGLILRPLEIEVAALNEILDMENMPTINHIDKTSRSGSKTIRGSEVLGFTSKPKISSHPLQEQLAETFASVPTIPGSQLDGSQHTKHSGLWDIIVAQEVDAALLLH
ncbi:Patterned Expression Site family member [Echinococcus multilocularis]|uniref:Patterned Expression Site family member n=1 Tax=Echinococcus multilocularis TaxID=6211 RepID=A0A068YG39_ECHMU|nr:Patterned Expression Site family member [Echinococcus multilocularis]